MPRNPIIAVLPPVSLRAEIFTENAMSLLESLGEVRANEAQTRDLTEEEARELIAGADVVITSWGSPRISPEIVDAAPDLRLHCHAAGTVKPFISDAEWERGIVITSAAAAIAVSVAETTLGWIIIAAKRALTANTVTHTGGWKKEMPLPPGDLRHKTIGIVGASHVGRRVIELLKNFENDVVLYDPYVDEDQAEKLGVRKVDLPELMRSSDIVSLHAPSVDATRHMINRDTLALMKHGASLINTARGSLIDEQALTEVLEQDKIWAFIDVTDPEPPAPDHPFRRLPNCVLTPHIAGGVEAGRFRIGDYTVEEVRRFVAGELPAYPILREALSRIG